MLQIHHRHWRAFTAAWKHQKHRTTCHFNNSLLFFSFISMASPPGTRTLWYSSDGWAHSFLANFHVNCPHHFSSLQTLTSYLCRTTWLFSHSDNVCKYCSESLERISKSSRFHHHIIICCFSWVANPSIRPTEFNLSGVHADWPWGLQTPP